MDVTITEDVVTDEQAIEIAELGVEASEVLITEMVDLEGGRRKAQRQRLVVTDIANARNCGGDRRPDRAICTSIFDATSHLYTRLCRSVHPSVSPLVRLSVRPSVGPVLFSKIAVLKIGKTSNDQQQQ